MLLSDDSAINVPALAAARVVRRYTAQVYDELSLEVRASSDKRSLATSMQRHEL